ncbi:hypothetical protein C8R43DRAFT_941902 [Mycena crocata]|nr:hypothetical protein C8R43DRAFT_941902 [Mycena crocata]
MADPTLCRGKDAEGNQCICMCCKETYVEDGTNRVLCKNCDHIESAHPEPKRNLDTFIRGFKDAAKVGSSSSLPVQTSRGEAAAERSAGLRPNKRKSDTDTEPPSKKPNKGKGKAKSTEKSKPEEEPKVVGETVKYGKFIFITCGMTSDGVLRRPRMPNTEEMEAMRQAGLVVLSTPSKPLSVNTSWDSQQVNNEVRRLVPAAVAFLERQPYGGNSGDSLAVQKQLFLGVLKQGKNLYIAGDPFPTGVELADHCKSAGRTSSERLLIIASKAKIPHRRWDWEESESEELGSEIDTVPSEDIVHSPLKATKNKKKVIVKTEPGLKGDQESDMRLAAKMRTRLSTGSLPKPRPLFIRSSSSPIPGPSGSNSAEVLVVSDDDKTPPPIASILSTWNPRIPTKSPSPAPSPEAASPINEDPPDFYDDFTWHPPPPEIQRIDAIASSSSTTTAPAIPSWITPIPASSSSSSSLSTPAPSVSTWEATALRDIPAAPTVAKAAPRFTKMGRGRGNKERMA